MKKQPNNKSGCRRYGFCKLLQMSLNFSAATYGSWIRSHLEMRLQRFHRLLFAPHAIFLSFSRQETRRKKPWLEQQQGQRPIHSTSTTGNHLSLTHSQTTHTHSLLLLHFTHPFSRTYTLTHSHTYTHTHTHTLSYFSTHTPIFTHTLTHIVSTLTHAHSQRCVVIVILMEVHDTHLQTFYVRSFARSFILPPTLSTFSPIFSSSFILIHFVRYVFVTYQFIFVTYLIMFVYYIVIGLNICLSIIVLCRTYMNNIFQSVVKSR